MKLACIQINSGSNIDDNLKSIDDLVRKAMSAGATFICTPENTCHIVAKSADKLNSAPTEDNHRALHYFREIAKELGVTISVGSLSVKISDDRLANRSYLIAPTGDIIATYDKMHLFDVQLAGGEHYRESDIFVYGEEPVLAQTDFAKIGMSICYDVRFPHLYRQYALAGAEILLIPAAFTVPTGEAHWHTLLRARAIENGCFVIAAAQTGTHDGGRKTYGHSLIIDPWGTVLADAGTDVGFIIADIDLNRVNEVRAQIPSLQHGRI
jgi:predicted amidohydrolase